MYMQQAVYAHVIFKFAENAAASAAERTRRADVCSAAVRCCLVAAPQGTTCPRGELCNYTHNIYEYWCHPKR